VVRFAVKAALTPAAIDGTDYKLLHDRGMAEFEQILAT
jgi:hypothetical protein